MSNDEQDQTHELVEVHEAPGAVQPMSMGMLTSATPDAMLVAGAAIATPLRKFIEDRGLFKIIGDKRHVYFEGWLTMATMLGVFAQEISVEEVAVPVAGWGPKYVAKMAMVRVADQQVVCSASAECGGVDERDWHWTPKYKWVTDPNDQSAKPRSCKVPDGEVPVPGNQRRSMAITRATSKAMRMGFAWIMQLGGYSPTPAEEMNAADVAAAASSDPERPAEQRDPGRNPRDMMGNRGAYTPGGQNPPRQETAAKAAPAAQAAPAAAAADGPEMVGGARRMASRFRFDCMVCGADGKAGEEIAFRRDGNGTYVAHWACHTGQKGGGK